MGKFCILYVLQVLIAGLILLMVLVGVVYLTNVGKTDNGSSSFNFFLKIKIVDIT